MGLFDKVGSFLKREAKDLGDAAESAKGKLDQELTNREQELKLTPSEKIAALQQQASSSDERLDAIADKATGRGALADAVEEVGAIPTDVSLPNVTHIVLPDGRVRSGNDIPGHVVDDQGTLHEVPVVDAPSSDDLNKFDAPIVAASAADQATTAHAIEDVLSDTAVDEKSVPGPVGDEPGLPAPDLPAPPVAVTEEPELPSPPAAAITKEAEPELPAPPAPAAFTEATDHEPAAPSETEADQDEAEDVASADPAKNPSSPDYGKTPAQIKYEQARAAANDLLNELRGELKDEGEI